MSLVGGKGGKLTSTFDYLDGVCWTKTYCKWWRERSALIGDASTLNDIIKSPSLLEMKIYDMAIASGVDEKRKVTRA